MIDFIYIYIYYIYHICTYCVYLDAIHLLYVYVLHSWTLSRVGAVIYWLCLTYNRFDLIVTKWDKTLHYNGVIMSAIASQITSLTIVYSSVYWGADQRKHQSSASLAFVGEIHQWPVYFPHKGPVTRKMFPFDDVIMTLCALYLHTLYSSSSY